MGATSVGEPMERVRASSTAAKALKNFPDISRLLSFGVRERDAGPPRHFLVPGFEDVRLLRNC